MHNSIPCIANPGARWKLVISFTLHLLYLQGECFQYPVGWRLAESWPSHWGQVNNLLPLLVTWRQYCSVSHSYTNHDIRCARASTGLNRRICRPNIDNLWGVSKETSASNNELRGTFVLTWSKGKAIPLQTRTDPEGSRSLTIPDIKIIGTWKW
jgi:hypothetical protein